MNDKPSSIYQLIQSSCVTHADQIALTYVTQVEPEIKEMNIPYPTLLAQVNRTARLVREQTGGKNEAVVTFLLPNIPQAHFILWGTESIAISNPLNPLLSVEAMVALMEKAGSDMVLALGPNPTSDIWQKTVQAVARLKKKPKLMSVAFPNDDGFEHFDEAMMNMSGDELPLQWQRSASDIAAYFHTGGTTGTPKLAIHSHENQVQAALTCKQHLHMDEGDAVVNGLPLFHVAGAMILSLGVFSCGANCILPTAAGFRNPQVIKQYWRLVERYGVVIGGGIPTSMASMLSVPIANADISSIRYLISGGAPVPIAVAEGILKMTGKPLYQIYGMTECAGVVTLPNLASPPPMGSVGYVHAPVEVRIDASDDKAGEIFIRSPMVFPGYLGGAGSEFADGWLRSGDIGYLDEDNNLFITGRAKDVIIRSGHNIDPATIEHCLESHKDVALAAAIGKPDEYAGELPIAYVQLHDGARVTETELLAFVGEHIDERPACPKEVIILPALPLTAVGKIHKPSLKVMAVNKMMHTMFARQVKSIEVTLSVAGKIEVKLMASHLKPNLRDQCDALHKKLGLSVTLLQAQSVAV